MIEQIINVGAPVFIAIACGWVWSKTGRGYNTDLESSLVIAIGAPCLVFFTLSALTISLPLLWRMGMNATDGVWTALNVKALSKE